jgi:hypothetical protein
VITENKGKNGAQIIVQIMFVFHLFPSKAFTLFLSLGSEGCERQKKKEKCVMPNSIPNSTAEQQL